MKTNAERLMEIFARAKELRSPAERGGYLAGACEGEPELRQEVESLLIANSAAGEFLLNRVPIGASAAQKTMLLPPLSEVAGTRIGRYKLLEQIGEGGFGVVWMAEQEEPVRRRVALKIIKLGMDTQEVVARFEAERQALAMMDHPNIAVVFDGGATDTGRPFFVMELVKGIPITDYCDANKLSTRERLELFMQVCHAVQHAHQKGVIHRDLKPSNILVTVKDDQPVPKVIDFGVAKATQAQLTEKTVFTRFQQWIGTPAYMSPEQAGLGSLDVDTRSDVYSLGVLLYELLTGRPPFDTQKLLAAGYDAVMRTIREEEPAKPSTRLSTLKVEELSQIATHRHADPAQLERAVQGDLDWIVMKALEKNRTRRYDTANALARDLEHHLNNEPVSAVAPTFSYRLQKLARRHRKAAAWTVSFALLLVLTALVSTILAVYAQRQKTRAEQAENITGDNLYAADMALTQRALEARQLVRARDLLRSYIPKAGEVDRRGIEWRKLWTEARGSQVAVIPIPIEGAIWGLAFTPDDEFIVAAGAGGGLCVIHAEDFKLVYATNAAARGTCRSLAVSADGKLVATGYDGSAGSACVWKMAADGTLELAWQIAGRDCCSVAFSPDDRTLAVGMRAGKWPGGSSGITSLFEVATGRQLAELPQSGGWAVAFSSDGRWLATAPGNGKTINLWDAQQFSLITRMPGEEAFSLAFSSDNRRLFAGSILGGLFTYQMPTQRMASVVGPRYWGRAIVALSTSRQLMARCDGPVITVQDFSGNVLEELVGHETQPCSVGFDHRGDWLVSGAEDGKILIWNVPGANSRHLTAPANSPLVRYFKSLPLPPSSPSGDKIAVLASDGVRVLDAALRRASPPICPPAYPLTFESEDSLLVFRGLAFIEDENIGRPHTNDPAPRLEWWNLRAVTNSGVEISRLAGKQVTAVAVSPDKATLVLAWRVGETTSGLEFVDSHSGELCGIVAGLTNRINGIAFAPNGRLLAVAVSGRVELIAFPSGEKLKTLVGGVKGWAERPAFSPDGTLLAVGFWDGICLWGLPDGRRLRFLGGYSAPVYSLLFSADSKTLVAWGGETKFWHVATWRDTPLSYERSSVSKPWLPLAGEKYVCFRDDNRNWEVASLAPLDQAEEWLRAQPASLTEARRTFHSIMPRDSKTPQ